MCERERERGSRGLRDREAKLSFVVDLSINDKIPYKHMRRKFLRKIFVKYNNIKLVVGVYINDRNKELCACCASTLLSKVNTTTMAREPRCKGACLH